MILPRPGSCPAGGASNYDDRVNRAPTPPRASSAEPLRRRLVAELEQLGALRSTSVRDAFLLVPRELFISEFADREGLEAAYRNQLVVTKSDTNGFPLSSASEPQVMAAMLERLQLREGMRVLEIGTGTGYNTALMKTIVGRRGTVVSVELDREVARKARAALRAGGYAVRVRCADGHLGYATAAPYDRIVLTAGSATITRAWLDQLVDGGLLELPLRMKAVGLQAIATFRRTGHRLESVSIVPGQFMQLRGDSEVAPTRVPSLPVKQVLTKGSETVVVQLSGMSLERLSTAGWRRLFSLGEPRRRSLGVRFPVWSLGLYLTLEIPESLLVARWEDLAIGVLGRAGRSIAFVEGRWEGGHRPTQVRILAYGDSEAEERLDAILREWSDRGRPDLDQLRISAIFRSGNARISHAWLAGKAATRVS
jgi:protein-L-isoaspartate(D-aspartate) O-methyltransferase